MRLQIFINRRSKFEERPLDRRATQLCLICRSEIDAFSRGQRSRELPLSIPNALLPALFEQPHEVAERVQTARESAIRVKLNENFLDLIHGQPGVETVGQRLFQFRHIPARRVHGDFDQFFFLFRQGLHNFLRLRLIDKTKENRQHPEKKQLAHPSPRPSGLPETSARTPQFNASAPPSCFPLFIIIVFQ